MSQENNKLFGRILIADDEQTFQEATAQLLQNEGFECDCAKDAEQALAKLSEKTYDLLIADIKMPGNPNLELIKHLAQTTPQLSIILVTGYPSQQTAIEAIHLPITAYFVKPVDFAELLQKTRAAVKMSRFYKTITATRKSLKQWTDELETIELALKNGKYDAFEISLKSFIDITTIKIDDTFNAIRRITDLLEDLRPQMQICRVIRCPALAELTKGLEQSIISLKKSRELYKSKQLAQVRAKLEKLLQKLQTN